jgi:hypothetical protein
MGAKRSVKTELDQLKIILSICKRNAPDTLRDQNTRIAKKIKELSKVKKKKGSKRGKV